MACALCSGAREQPWASYGGYLISVSLCNGSVENSRAAGGCMRVVLNGSLVESVAPYFSVGQYFGIQRGRCLDLIYAPHVEGLVLQGINSIGISPEGFYFGHGRGNVDIIDYHTDRLWPEPMYVMGNTPIGQTSLAGRWRIFHFSQEAVWDDMMDDLAEQADVLQVDREHQQRHSTGCTWQVGRLP